MFVTPFYDSFLHSSLGKRRIVDDYIVIDQSVDHQKQTNKRLTEAEYIALST